MKNHLTLQNFQEALITFPESQRLVSLEGSIESTSTQEGAEANKANESILQELQQALIKEYGSHVAAFALPSSVLEARTSVGLSLDGLLLKKVLRKARNLSESLLKHHSSFPLSEKPSDEECQAYLNAIATYSKQEAEDVAQDKNSSHALTTTLADDLMTSLFMAISGPALEALGNYINKNSASIPAAIAGALNTMPHPTTIAAFGLTSLIMHSSSHGAAAAALNEDFVRAADALKS